MTHIRHQNDDIGKPMKQTIFKVKNLGGLNLTILKVAKPLEYNGSLYIIFNLKSNATSYSNY